MKQITLLPTAVLIDILSKGSVDQVILNACALELAARMYVPGFNDFKQLLKDFGYIEIDKSSEEEKGLNL